MECQKHLFQLPEDVHYLNGAYMSPMLRSVEEAGIIGMRKKRNPFAIKTDDYFNEAVLVQTKFGQLVNCKPGQVAMIPSASYGLKNAISNVIPGSKKFAVGIAHDFPSGYYAITDWCKEHGRELKLVSAPESRQRRGEVWTNQIIESIDMDTAIVVMSSNHWTDGTKFDLKKIGQRCKEVGAVFIVDGTQSVGALPIDVIEFNIDALVCATYKWLMGPYSFGLAYYNETFNSGKPIEDSWLNRSNAKDFSRLTEYVDTYMPGASRFNVGEYSNFIVMPMVAAALDQILAWKVPSIEKYCGDLIQPLLKFLRENDYWVEDDAFRTNHLFGFLTPPGKNRDSLLKELQEKKIVVSVRGEAIRVSPYLYNTVEDIEKLIAALKV